VGLNFENPWLFSCQLAEITGEVMSINVGVRLLPRLNAVVHSACMLTSAKCKSSISVPVVVLPVGKSAPELAGLILDLDL